MNKPERLVPRAEALDIVRAAKHGVLSLVAPTGAPYGVPVNYYYDAEAAAIYLHCAPQGKKLDCIRRETRVSLTVVARADIAQERLTTYYESAIVEGRATIITAEDEIRLRLQRLCDALAPAATLKRDAAIEASLGRVAIVKIEITAVTGKRNSGI